MNTPKIQGSTGTKCSTPRFVSSYRELGQAVGCHPKSFQRWRTKFNDCPAPRQNGKHDVAAWKKWLKANGIDLAESSPEKLTWEIERIRLQCAKLDFQNEVDQGKYLLAGDVNAWLVAAIERIKFLLHHKLKNELPGKIVGLTALEIAARMEPLITAVCEALRWGLPQVKKGNSPETTAPQLGKVALK